MEGELKGTLAAVARMPNPRGRPRGNRRLDPREFPFGWRERPGDVLKSGKPFRPLIKDLAFAEARWEHPESSEAKLMAHIGVSSKWACHRRRWTVRADGTNAFDDFVKWIIDKKLGNHLPVVKASIAKRAVDPEKGPAWAKMYLQLMGVDGFRQGDRAHIDQLNMQINQCINATLRLPLEKIKEIVARARPEVASGVLDALPAAGQGVGGESKPVLEPEPVTGRMAEVPAEDKDGRG